MRVIVRANRHFCRLPVFNWLAGPLWYGILPLCWEFCVMTLVANSHVKPHGRRWPRRNTTRKGALPTVTAAAVVAVVLAASGGYWWWSHRDEKPDDSHVLLHTVARDDFELSITERGEIEAFDVTEVRSLVKSNNTTGNAILRIVPEGTPVKKGDFLVELDSSALEAQRTSQQILVNDAKALEVEAHNNYDVAVIAKREYLEGTYLQERQTAESEQFVAEENLNRAKEYYAYSQKLASKGYVNENQLEADRFAVEKANKDLDAAKTKIKVLDEFTKPKQVSTLESAILIAKAKWEAAQNGYKLEMEKLADLDDQIAKCTILAPQDGVVKYAHLTDNRGDQQFIVEEGTLVRERQTIIKLPNADSMRVNLTVNESLVQYVQPGYTAEIRPVGFGDRVLHGVVEKVNQYAEPTSWRQANVKDYKAFIRISDVAADLRSGMTASVTIHCADVPDAIQVPVQSIYAWGPKFYCFAYDNGSWQAREIKPGPTNDKFFVVEEGLKEGERVALNPRAYVSYVSLPKLPPEEIQRAVPQPSSGEQTAEKRKPAAGAAVIAGNAGPGAPGAVGPRGDGIGPDSRRGGTNAGGPNSGDASAGGQGQVSRPAAAQLDNAPANGTGGPREPAGAPDGRAGRRGRPGSAAADGVVPASTTAAAQSRPAAVPSQGAGE
jgi:HlyD family secretion protein